MFPDDPVFLLSMVVATLGRSSELELLFASLAAFGRRDFEIILVDQNKDERLAPIVAAWGERLNIRHLRTDRPGVCRARNLGAAEARGTWLMFPDDDCWYPADLLERFEAVSPPCRRISIAGARSIPTARRSWGAFPPSPNPSPGKTSGRR